jgi:hypothetical protein
VLRHVTRFVRASQRFSAELFTSQDVTIAARALYKSRATLAFSAGVVLRSTEPAIRPGPSARLHIPASLCDTAVPSKAAELSRVKRSDLI